MATTSPVSIRERDVPVDDRAADLFLALLTDCDIVAASLFSSISALASLSSEMVARTEESALVAKSLIHSTRTALLARKTRVMGSAKRLSRKQCKQIIATFDAVDVSTEQLCVWAGVAGASRACPNQGFDVDSALLLTSRCSIQASTTGLGFKSALPSASVLGSVVTGDGLRVVSAAGPGLKWFEPHSRNEFTVVLAQADGSVPVWLTTGDIVLIGITSADTAPSATGAVFVSPVATVAVTVFVSVTGEAVASVVYWLGELDSEPPDIVLQLAVCGAPLLTTAGGCDWTARVPRRPLSGHRCAAVGTPVRTLSLREGSVHGIAVSADEQWLVVNRTVLHVHSLPSGELVRTFGSEDIGLPPYELSRSRPCFAPNSNLILVDRKNRRLHELTLHGVVVRCIGVGAFRRGVPGCVAVHDDVIAVVCSWGTSPGSRVLLFDFDTGTVTSCFGRLGTGPGQLSRSSAAIHFAQDGCHVIVANSRRLSVFTTAGVFVRCLCVPPVGLGHDVFVFQSVTGEYVVIEEDTFRVCVISPDGSELVRSWALKAPDTEEMDRYSAILRSAASGKHLYVLDEEEGTVQVFE